MNSVTLIGNLTKSPELRYTTGSDPTAICRFSIAVNDGYGDKQRTSYIPIVVFGKRAENCDKFLSKGSKVGIEGRIQTGSYEKDGRTIYTTDVIANNVEFLTQKSNTERAPETPQEPQNEPQTQQTDMGGFTALVDDDIPFE